MDRTRQDFEERKREIENQFKFLKIFDDENTKIKYLQSGEVITERINPKFQKILIANSFLILYNLIEATVRNSIIEIYDKVEEDEITYETLSENLKKIWVKQKASKLRENNYRQDTLRESISEIANDILNEEIIKLDKNNIDISGNLDAKKIRELAASIGFQEPTNGRNLLDIKNKRNRLAHGEHTFYDVGRNYTVNEIDTLKKETFDYLEDVIQKIENYISSSNYKITD